MKFKISMLAAVVFLVSCGEKKEQQNTTATKEQAPHYETVAIKQGSVASVIKLPARLVAYQEVSIFPKVNGYVTKVLVDIGSHVHKGQLLMTLEAPELEQAVLGAKERYERAKSTLSIDKDRYYRLKEASATAGAVSPLDLSSAKNKVEADSALANAEKANWQMQRTMMDYLNVTAAFDGVITIRNVHPGALVSAANKDVPMLELKQTSHLRLQVDMPETIAAQLKDKDTISFFVTSFPGKKWTGNISRKAYNISADVHAERVEIDVFNKDESLDPGMYADVVYYAKGNQQALVVPKSAVVTSTERKYVVVIRDGKTQKVDVSTGNETTDETEIFGNIKQGEQVVAKANDEIKEGVAVQ
ncbi:MAG: efflux RND transporter periplasmic adaptor subunit [Bacteroidota bacterium]|nr:efflux RND transporter periplasmic adaptor subunit [Bacteroidota bacterium]